jgi:hypothetical protein
MIKSKQLWSVVLGGGAAVLVSLFPEWGLAHLYDEFIGLAVVLVIAYTLTDMTNQFYEVVFSRFEMQADELRIIVSSAILSVLEHLAEKTQD